MQVTNEAVVENITPLQAEKWLNAVNHEKQKRLQRPIRQLWVSHLASEMLKGRFLPVGTIHFVFENGTTYLVNGQHTLSAVIEAGQKQQLNVVRTRVTNEDEVKQYYYRYDAGLKRSFEDSLRALQVDKELGSSRHYLTKVAASVKYMHNRFSGGSRTRHYANDDLVRTVYLWYPFFAEVIDAIKDINQQIKRQVENRTVLSVAMATMRYQPKKAREFWYQVVADDGIAGDDPRKTLNKFLITARMFGGSTSGRNAYMASDVTNACAISWNAFVSGRSLKQLRLANASFNLDGVNTDEVYKELDGIFSTVKNKPADSSIETP